MNKNMKRVLSLVLAFVMVIGMMVPSFAEDTAPKVDKSKFQMMVVDGNGNTLGDNPRTIAGDVDVTVEERAAVPGTTAAFGTSTATAESNGLGVINITNLKADTEYKVTVDLSQLNVKNIIGTPYYSEDADAITVNDRVVTLTFTTGADAMVKMIGRTPYTEAYVVGATARGGSNDRFSRKIEDYYIQVKDVNNNPVMGVPVKLYKAVWNDVALRYEADKTGPVVDLGTSSDKDGQVSINIEKNMVADKNDPKKMVWDGTIKFIDKKNNITVQDEVMVNGKLTKQPFANGQLFVAVTEDASGTPTAASNATVGLMHSQAVIDMWQYEGKDRVFDSVTGKLVKRDATDNSLTLKSEPRQWEIILQEKPVNIIVKVFNNGVTPGIRKPVAGAEIALYDVIAPDVLNSKVKDSDFAEKAKATTDKYGHAVFENVDMSSMESYWIPNASGVLKPQSRKVPYAIKQLSAPEGLTPYAGYIFTNGYYANEYANNGGSNHLIVERKLDGQNLIIEIENRADAFNYEGRIFGKDRYVTAVEIAKKAFPNGLERVDTNFNRKTVVLAQGHQFSDALVAGPVAEMSKAPILLTAKNSVPAVTLEYLVANGVEQVIIMGGSNTVSDAVIATLNKAVADGGAGIKHTHRIEGANRYATAVEAGTYLLKAVRDNNVANSRFDWGFTPNNKTGSMVFVANGLNFADALTASVPAAAYGAPILLTDGNKLPAETAQALKDWKIVNAYVIGGEKSVSANEFAEIAKVATVKRVAGVNRTDTSLQVAKKFIDNASHAYFASGVNAADALTGVILGVKDRAPIILVSGNEVSESVADYINNSQLTSGTILGGPNSISTQLRDALSKQINLKK